MSAKHFFTIVFSLWGIFLAPPEAQAMTLEEMKRLPGANLLDLRVDALFQQCGLPSGIADSAGTAQSRQTISWEDATMQLSAQPWEIQYARLRDTSTDKISWHNPKTASDACMAGLASLLLNAKGEVGILSVKKRADNNGYLTSYTIPKNLYTAHQVTGYTAVWNQGQSVGGLQKTYGAPDEKLPQAGGKTIHRYWVVDQDNRMPIAVFAVDFVIKDAERRCVQFSVYSRGSNFVQEKFDALLREWEKIYVLD